MDEYSMAAEAANKATTEANEKNTPELHRAASSRHRIAEEHARMDASYGHKTDGHQSSSMNHRNAAQALEACKMPMRSSNAPRSVLVVGMTILEELTARRLAGQKPLEAALLDTGYSLNDLQSNLSKALRDVDLLNTQPEGESMPCSMSPWVTDVLCPDHEDGEVWEAIVSACNGKLYCVKFQIGADGDEAGVKVVGEPSEVERTTDYNYVGEMEAEARSFGRQVPLTAAGTSEGAAKGWETRKGGMPFQFGADHKSTADSLAEDKWSNDGPNARISKSEAMDAVTDNHYEQVSEAAYKHHGVTDPENVDDKTQSKVMRTEGRISRRLADHIREHGNKAISEWKKLGGEARSSSSHGLTAGGGNEPGHPFWGNQHTDGTGGMTEADKHEMITDAHSDLKAKGIKEPTHDEVVQHIKDNHGIKVSKEDVKSHLTSTKKPKKLSGAQAQLQDDVKASQAGSSEPLNCASASKGGVKSLLGQADETSLMYMPAGVHTITPSMGGDPVTVTVNVTRESADKIASQYGVLCSKGMKPFFSLLHDSQIAAFRPSRFYWDTKIDATGARAEGIWCDGEWTESGRKAKEGKDVWTFSPTFFVDADIQRTRSGGLVAMNNGPETPCNVVCNPMAGANMGAVENDPAFKEISPLWARSGSGVGGIGTMPRSELSASVRDVHEALRANNPSISDIQQALFRKSRVWLSEAEVGDLLLK